MMAEQKHAHRPILHTPAAPGFGWGRRFPPWAAARRRGPRRESSRSVKAARLVLSGATTLDDGENNAMRTEERDAQISRATKLTFMGIFLTGMAAFSAQVLKRGENVQVQPYDLVLLGLATFRTGRMVAYERVAQPLREPVTETKPDFTGAGETVVAKGHGLQHAIGELVSCPICIGTWAAAGMVYGLHLAPQPTRVFLSIMGATGAAELMFEASEALAWLGRAARRQCGE